jgi:dihydrofolate synthase/folylpolyglutamate synthase
MTTQGGALVGLDPTTMRQGVGPTRHLLDALGAPDRKFPTVLVAGTNGKGSVAATLAAIATVSGRRCGLYTSPDLEGPTERIRVDGVAISPEALDTLVGQVRLAAAGRPEDQPTYFEVLTCAAALAFEAAGVELAVFEVGLGGRLDATNALEPRLSVVTTIGLDHQAILGADLATIAGEKAGIFRAATPALVAPGPSEVLAAFESAASRVGADLEVATLACGFDDGRIAIAGRRTYRCRPGLAGLYQVGNLAIAARAAERLEDLRLLPQHAGIAEGIARVRWPGRLERVEIPTGVVIFDGAHNPSGVDALLATLGAQPFDLVFGALADKDVTTMLRRLARRAARVTLTRPLGTNRALEPDQLARLLPDPAQAALAATPAIALDQALESQPRFLVVAGSLYLIGEARVALRQRYGVPAAAAAISTVAPPSVGPSALCIRSSRPGALPQAIRGRAPGADGPRL